MAMKEVMEAPKMDNLFSATQIFPVVPDVMEVTGAFKRGQLLASSGNAIEDGTEVYAVLAADTEGAGKAPVYLTGEFNANALIACVAVTPLECKAAARKIGIFIKENIPA